MSQFRISAAVATAALLALVGAGCSSSAKSATPTTTPSTTTPPTTASSGSAATVPTAKTIDQPVTYGYYDGHIDEMLSTDVSNKAQASSSRINYSAALLNSPAGKNPSLYMISGPAAPNQPMVFNTEPGEDDYSPLWQEVTVKWKPGVKPVLLVKDDQINSLASKGQLTATPTGIVLNCPIVKVTK